MAGTSARCGKWSLAIGRNGKGQGTEILGLADGARLPLAVPVAGANPSEISLVEDTLPRRVVCRLPTRIIGDRGYDPDTRDARLATRGLACMAPHRSMRRNVTPEGRPRRRYCRRGEIERLFAGPQNYRRLVTRDERHVEALLAPVPSDCIVIHTCRFVR